MTTLSDTAWLWAAKGTGAIAGSAISLAYLLPQGRREAALRFAVGVVSGVVFGGTAGVKIAKDLGIDDVLGPGEVLIMGSAAASVCAWWALGFVVRSFERGVWPRDRPWRGVDDPRDHKNPQ